jgi:hypothetical protein
MKRRQVVYRFKKKIGGSWPYVLDKDGSPLTLTTDKPRSTVKHVLKATRPDIAYLHNVMALEVWPDMEATKKLEEFKDSRKSEDDKQYKNTWYYKDSMKD